MKFAKHLLVAGIAVAVLSGCGGNDKANTANQAASPAPAAEKVDAVTAASIVDQGEGFKQAVSESGTWIIATLNDVTLEEEVTVAGEFHDKGAADGDVYRKIALYAQDADHKITASYTLTVPKLTVQSENLRVQGGTIKGDVYVEAKGFNLHESATIDGNLYFASEDVKATAVIDGKVTGATEIK
ncbi:polymer-forming cytoskeletal protein [Paenibacillus albidus]|uniref:polymer-forming cytoskeletal protein n=1 Tax=Paenibacillus albidus TaxID=2041023 RepID=UPI001BEC47B6|nr:polymer-forming cytoskeletal protein [Paenibacillus albidus]MBT2292943.1 polymer-forming cytoskeletal protein [Paenibacillus albidus]